MESINENEILSNNVSEENAENEEDAATGSQNDKEKKRRSHVWQHFSTLYEGTGKDRIEFMKCNYCDKKYLQSKKANSSTSNMKRHLKNIHSEIFPANVPEQEEHFVFSQETFRKALLKWVVVCDQPFTEVQQVAFVELIKTVNPEAVTISAKTIKRDVMKKFAVETEKVKQYISKVPGKISFTIDGWTSKNVLSFLAIRTHFINVDWKYESLLLDFVPVDGSHSGFNLSQVFVDCLKQFGIPMSKVMGITMDNVSSNDTFMEWLDCHGISAADNRVRCLAHILNLSVQDLMSSLKIASPYEVNVPIFEDSGESDVEDRENQDVDMVAEEDQNSDSDWEDVVDVKPSQPTVLKLRKLMKKIRKSTQLRQKLRKLCKMYHIDYLTPMIDVKTRWNSTFHMIQRAAKLKTPLRVLCLNTKSLQLLLMKEIEWTELNKVAVLLNKFDRATKLVSMERHSTITSYLPTLHWLLDSLKTFIRDNPGHLADAAGKGLEKLQKYECELNIQYSTIPYAAVLLNPSLKMSYFREHKFRNVKEIKTIICEIFERDYETGIDNTEPEQSEDEFYVHVHKKAKVTKAVKEFEKYLQFPLSSSKIDCLDFWRSQVAEFPNLAIMARDILPVQSSSVPVERDFSSGVDLVTPTRCSLDPETIRACMCLKMWYRDFTFNSS